MRFLHRRYKKKLTKKKESFKNGETIPPIKLLRLKLKQKFSEKENNKFELAPTAADLYTGEIET